MTRKAALFLKAYAATGEITRAAKAADVSKSAHYDWMRRDRNYRRAFELAKEEAFSIMEDECHRRAVEGWNEPVTYMGRISQQKDPKTGKLVPVTIRKFSDSNLQFLMRGAKPHVYRERYQVQHTGAVATHLKFSGQMVDLLALYHELTHDADKDEDEKA